MPRFLLAGVVLAAAFWLAGTSGGAGDGVDCRDPMNQHDLNYCAELDFDRSDARLNRVYKRLLARLDIVEVNRIREAQRAWIIYRDSECRFSLRANEGGSMYPMLWSGCRQRLTEIRTRELQAHLDCAIGRPTCTE